MKLLAVISGLRTLVLLTFLCSITLAQTVSWQAANTPRFYTGQVHQVISDQDGNMFATINGAIVHSSDHGESWELNDTFDPKSGTPGGDYLAAGSSGTVFCLGFDSLFASTDHGQTWQGKSSTGYSIEVNSSGTLFISRVGGFYKSTDEGDTWTRIGDGLPADWQAMETIASAYPPTTDYIFCVGSNSKYFRSTDNGETFSPFVINLEDTTIGWLAISPVTGALWATAPNAIITSSDNGDSWTTAGSFPPYTLFWKITVDNNGYVFVNRSNAEQVWYRREDLIGWATVDVFAGLIRIGASLSSIDATADEGVIVGADKAGVFRRDPVSDRWISLSDDFPGAINDVTTIAVNPAGIGIAIGTFGTYSSTDFGLNWTRDVPYTFEGLGQFLYHPSGCFFGTIGFLFKSIDSGHSWVQKTTFNVNATSVAPNGDLLVMGGDIMRSTDLGETWGLLWEHPNPDIIPIGRSISSQFDSVILASYDWVDNLGETHHVVLHTYVDGDSWGTVSVPYRVREFAALTRERLFMATDGGLYESTNHGATWVRSVILGSLATRSLVANAVGDLFAGTATSGIYESTDGGDSWFSINEGLGDLKVNKLVFDQFGFLYAAKEADGVYRTTASTTPTTAVLSRSSVDFGTIIFGSTVSDTLLLTNTGSLALTVSPVVDNGAVSVDPPFAAILPGESLSMTVTFSPEVPGAISDTILFASNAETPLSAVVTGQSTGALFSSEGIINMGEIHVGEQRDSVIVVENIGFRDSLVIESVESTDPSFFLKYTSDPILPGGTGVDSIAFRPEAEGTYSALLLFHSNSVFSPDTMKITGTATSGETTEDIPETFYLSQNYPNPFNPSTTIRFGLPTTSLVVLSLFNLLGEETELLSGVLEAGIHEYVLQSARFSTGIYFYRLRAGNFVETKKLVLLK